MTQTFEPGTAAGGAEQVAVPASAPAPSTSAIGAYSQRELQFVEREARGELAFRYIRNDGDPQHLEWYASLSLCLQLNMLLHCTMRLAGCCHTHCLLESPITQELLSLCARNNIA
jgi:hypothetical protein